MSNLKQSQFCDLTIERAVALMVERTGDMALVVDRMFTFAAAQACVAEGPAKASSMMHYMIAQVDAGAFDYLGQPDGRSKPVVGLQDTRGMCDEIVATAARRMIERGATIEMALDRLLTYSTAQACHVGGAFETAAMFRNVAAQVEAGAFAHVEPAQPGKGH